MATPPVVVSVPPVAETVSPSLAPTWKLNVAPLSRSLPLNAVLSPISRISWASWATSPMMASLSSWLQGAVLVLDRQVTDALQHRVDLAEGAFRGLDERDAVLRVALRLSETADLAAHLLRDGEAGGVVRGTVDAIAAGELLHGFEAAIDVVDS